VGELLLHPALPFLAGALLAWFVPGARRAVLVAVPLIALAQLAQIEVGTTVTTTYLGFDVEPMRADRLAMAFAWIFAIAALIAGVYGLATMRGREPTAALAYAGAASGVVFAGDLLTLFVFWEIKAVASTFVILSRRGGNADRAGIRYLFIHLVGGKLLLAGAVWHYASTGSLTFTGFDLGPATALILVAFLLSAAVPPLHAWLPDAYPEASVAGTVFLSAYTTKAAVYALARGFGGVELLVWLGVAMALYGVVYAVLENDIRRLLGYHIISQVGYMVAAVGIGTQMAINGATAHAFAHILYKGLLLMGAGAVIHATGRAKMTELGGIANRMRGVLALYMVGAVSISSVPLFSGFVSKELAVYAAGVDGRALAVLLLKIASVGTFLHTGLKLPFGTWFGREGPGPRTNEGHRVQVGPVPATMIAAMALSAALNLAIGVFPALLYDLLPFPVDYDPYTLSKVVEKSQILLFTALGFWILLDKLHAEPTVSLDTDVLYRRWGARLASMITGAPAPTGTWSGPRTRAGQVLARVHAATQTLPAARGTHPPVHPTWVLGVILLTVAVVLLLLSLGGWGATP
jgi:multicomponent Na+:H+ antiporter subunit D